MAIYTSQYTGAQIDAAVGKVNQGYAGVDYSIATAADNGNTTGNVTIDGTKALTVITVTGNVSVSLASGKHPVKNHSAHVILYNLPNAAAVYTVSISHDATERICPGGADPDPIEIPKGGYVELDFLCINATDVAANDKIYVRGI